MAVRTDTVSAVSLPYSVPLALGTVLAVFLAGGAG